MSLRLVDVELTSTIANALRARTNVKKVLLDVAKDDTCVLDNTKMYITHAFELHGH